jgi:DNA mismatch endonuclease, patch repair protein
MDTVDKSTRSYIMSRVGQRNTSPEIILRRELHSLGLRYRLHEKKLPGSPDLVFPRFGGVIFVHGCYWHSHGCYKSTVPQSSRTFWMEKFNANRQRDKRDIDLLLDQGWRVMVVWECALLGKRALPPGEVAVRVRAWLHSAESQGEVSGTEMKVVPNESRGIRAKHDKRRGSV